MSTRAPERPVKKPRPRQPIDPRIRQRRIEVQRDEGRRRLRRVAVVAIGAALVAGAWWLTLTPVFDVDHIVVHGADDTGADAVLEVVDIERGDALLTADVAGAARAVSRLPWVATATVHRSWPGTVSITIVERVAVAAVAVRGGGWVLVDRGGRQLATTAEPAVELVRIAGLAVTPRLGTDIDARVDGALDLAAATPPSLRGAIAALWPKRDGTVEATVKIPGGTAVGRFGRPDQLEAKLIALAAVLERADLARVHVIDLRVPGAPALTRG